MEDILIYDFCKVHIYNKFVIVEINEGVHVTPEHNTILVNLVDTYYRNGPFVYITNRVHNYTVDASVYSETSKVNNLIGFAMVSQTKHSGSDASAIEDLFRPSNFKLFSNLEAAIDWASSLHDKQ